MVVSNINISMTPSTHSHFASTAVAHRLADSCFTASPNRLSPSGRHPATSLFPVPGRYLDDGDTHLGQYNFRWTVVKNYNLGDALQAGIGEPGF